MRDPSFYVQNLLELHTVQDAAEKRALWRQALTALARGAATEGPSPLDGLHPDGVARGVRVALQSGFIDDLDWLAPSAANIALYELASAVPAGAEQRELGRRVLARLLGSNAEGFASLATRMAQTTGKGLSSPAVRARVALVCELPLSYAVGDGPMALAFVSKRELAREWITQPSTRSLPARRLAARLFERAAREAATRAARGDLHVLRFFQAEAIKAAWLRLLSDREPLVWRHLAVARGLLAPWVPELATEIERCTSLDLTPTEWRRAATSYAAMAAVRPESALKAATTFLAHGVASRDPGVGSAFVWGLARAAESEPEAASALFSKIVETARVDVAEAVLDLRNELGQSSMAEAAVETVAAHLAEVEGRATDDEGASSLLKEISRDLLRSSKEGQPLRDRISVGLQTYAQDSARAAHAVARELLERAKGQVDALEAITLDDDWSQGRAGSIARRSSLAILRDLDLSLLERNVLVDLLRLGSGAEAVKNVEEQVDKLRDRVCDWIVQHESLTPSTSDGGVDPSAHPTLRMRRLRALLHLVDSDLGEASDDSPRAVSLRQRWMRVAHGIMGRLTHHPAPVLRRAFLATFARTVDALIRVGACEVTDVFLVLAQDLDLPEEFETLSEASMDPDLMHMLGQYASFLRRTKPIVEPGAVIRTAPEQPTKRAMDRAKAMRVTLDSVKLSDLELAAIQKERQQRTVATLSFAPGAEEPPTGRTGIVDPASKAAALPPGKETTFRQQALSAFGQLAQELCPDASGRLDALRTVLTRLHTAMVAVDAATALRSLSTSGGQDADVLVQLESSILGIKQMCVGARSRFEPAKRSQPPSSVTERSLALTVSRVLAGAIPSLTEQAVVEAYDELCRGTPASVGRVLAPIARRLATLPIDSRAPEQVPVQPVVEQQLPAWLLPRRTIGGFYVVKPLGAGAAGSVFVVNRVEDRHETNAERFALKVPDYSATAARTISENEFFQMFRSEASALMAIPTHGNLARFVTLDLSARPKPILVMELVEGINLERMIASNAMDMMRAFCVLDDMLNGLEAMHAVGVGHLDLKPSNVVLRKGEEAVLVDFGLAGRNIRPGCATGPYGAPEVWGAVPDGVSPTPMAADVYAFGCIAFETLTGRVLFDAPNEVAQISMHIASDGRPPLMQKLERVRNMAPLCELLASTLRRDARKRPTVASVRASLRRISPELIGAAWPTVID